MDPKLCPPTQHATCMVKGKDKDYCLIKPESSPGQTQSVLRSENGNGLRRKFHFLPKKRKTILEQFITQTDTVS